MTGTWTRKKKGKIRNYLKVSTFILFYNLSGYSFYSDTLQFSSHRCLHFPTLQDAVYLFVVFFEIFFSFDVIHGTGSVYTLYA